MILLFKIKTPIFFYTLAPFWAWSNTAYTNFWVK